ncbi:MAG: hypothetical protein MSIBF_07115 [Candidatus Altiarchaeales archaeon IMC4]|nr:MAG: hypothetical protein MSIBF_07115 [Candidatus Altiarchaeales archaeon IMC4]
MTGTINDERTPRIKDIIHFLVSKIKKKERSGKAEFLGFVGIFAFFIITGWALYDPPAKPNLLPNCNITLKEYDGMYLTCDMLISKDKTADDFFTPLFNIDKVDVYALTPKIESSGDVYINDIQVYSYETQKYTSIKDGEALIKRNAPIGTNITLKFKLPVSMYGKSELNVITDNSTTLLKKPKYPFLVTWIGILIIVLGFFMNVYQTFFMKR